LNQPIIPDFGGVCIAAMQGKLYNGEEMTLLTYFILAALTVACLCPDTIKKWRK